MEETRPKASQNLILEDREKLTVTGVTEVEGFDERCIAVRTRLGELIIKGRELRIGAVSVETGDMSISGEIWSLVYGDRSGSRQSFLGKLFK